MSTTIIKGWRLRQLLRYRSEAANVDDPREFRIERYQRDYAWGPEDEAEDLYNDLTEHFDEDSGTYVLGNMILCPSVDTQVEDATALAALRQVEVVDGQQRLTTLLLLFAALRAEASKRSLSSMARKVTEAVEGVSFRHHEADMTAFMSDLLDDQDGSGWEAAMAAVRQPKSRSLANAIDVARHLRSLVSKRAEEDVSSIVMLATRILDEALVAATIADDRGAALLSFERANARGRDLDATDLLKNYVFMMEEAAASDRSNWDDIDETWKQLRDLAESRTPKLKFADLMRWHHEVLTRNKRRTFSGASLYRNIADELSEFGGSGVDYLAELRETVEWVTSVHRQAHRIVGGEPENVMDGLKGLALVRGRSQMKQHLPVLLAARDWPVAQFRELARSLESLMLVAVVCEIRGQVVDGVMRSAVQSIKAEADAEEDAGERRDAIVKGLVDTARGWAKDRGFGPAVKALRYSSSRESLLIRYVLSRADGAVKASANKVPWHDVDMFIESDRLTGGSSSRAVRDDLDHVWPQGRNKEWPHDEAQLDTIGNLVLWTHKANRAARDAPAAAKLADHYQRDSENRVRWLLARDDAGSGYDAVRELGLGSPKEWGPAQIEMLGDFYVASLYTIFGWGEVPNSQQSSGGGQPKGARGEA